MISPGTLEVLAALDEGPGTWSDITERTDLSESGVYANLEQLREQAVIDATPVERNGHTAMEYALRTKALDLGPAADRLLEELR